MLEFASRARRRTGHTQIGFGWSNDLEAVRRFDSGGGRRRQFHPTTDVCGPRCAASGATFRIVSVTVGGVLCCLIRGNDGMTPRPVPNSRLLEEHSYEKEEDQSCSKITFRRERARYCPPSRAESSFVFSSS